VQRLWLTTNCNKIHHLDRFSLFSVGIEIGRQHAPASGRVTGANNVASFVFSAFPEIFKKFTTGEKQKTKTINSSCSEVK
jgi:hypothetical protein